MTSLKEKTISGMIWSLLQNGGGRGISFIVTIILARLLTPEIFGLVGMLMIFIGLSQVLVQGGFNQALIQKKNTNEEDYSTVFWINLATSILIYCVLFILAPWISEFYNQPVLIELIRVLGLTFIFNAFSYVQEAKLQKEMQFRTLTIINIPSTILGGLGSIAMALLGYGVWSLIFLQIITRSAYAIQIWIFAKWKPLWTFNKAKAKELFSFGGNLMLSGIIGTAFNNVYVVVIGKFFPLDLVGYYQNANKLVQQPTRTISDALNKVMFPSFSTIQDDNIKLKKGYKKTIQQLLFWICPIFIIACVLAEPIFRVVLGTQWLPAVPYFQILCICGILYPLNTFNQNILKVKGRSDLFLGLDVIKKILNIIAIIIALPYGIWHIIWVQPLMMTVDYFVNSYYSGKLIDFGIKEQLLDIMPVLLISAFVGALGWLSDQSILNTLPNIFRILIGCVSMTVGYGLLVRFLKFTPYNDLLNILKNQRVFKKKE